MSCKEHAVRKCPYCYGKAADKPRNTYSCNCVDGKCSGCGGCCTDMLPLTAKELQRIKIYVREHRLPEHRQAPFFDQGAVDFTCPFRNETAQCCDIYAVRPKICRNFICSKPRPVAVAERDRITAGRKVYSLRWEIFGNPEALNYLERIRPPGLRKNLITVKEKQHMRENCDNE